MPNVRQSVMTSSAESAREEQPPERDAAPLGDREPGNAPSSERTSPSVNDCASEPPLCHAEREAERDLAAAAQRAGEQQVRDVRARDEQNTAAATPVTHARCVPRGPDTGQRPVLSAPAIASGRTGSVRGMNAWIARRRIATPDVRLCEIRVRLRPADAGLPTNHHLGPVPHVALANTSTDDPPGRLPP